MKIDNIEIELRRSNRKSLAIEVTQDAKVIVRAPLLLPVFQIKKFVFQKEEWIIEQVEIARKIYMEQEKGNDEDIDRERIRYLTAQARMHLPGRVKHFAEIMGVSYGRISIRHQKTRWGSCSGKGNLNFNCMLMAMPSEIQDYVVVHELCHLKEMNHSSRFWKEVEEVLPDYKERRAWLKANGSSVK